MLRVAIVHDYLRTYGGGERVLEALHEIWPQASVFVATADFSRLGIFAPLFRKMKIKTTWVQKIPLFRKYPLLYRPFLPLIWNSIDLSGYDVIISSSGANMAKNINKPKHVLHICFCHTPPRFLYGYETENRWFSQTSKFLTSFIQLYQKYDYKKSQDVDYFIANSKTVAERVRKHYGRAATVIPPPIMLSRHRVKKGRVNNYYLVVSRLVKHKHIDLIVAAFNQLGWELKIIGTGVEEAYLKKIAQKNIKFLGEVDDKQLEGYYTRSKALVIAAKDEDFGITAIEANYFGIPVIAYASGGLRETVKDGVTGHLFYKHSIKSLVDALSKLRKKKISRSTCINNAQMYKKSLFQKKIKTFVLQKWESFNEVKNEKE